MPRLQCSRIKAKIHVLTFNSYYTKARSSKNTYYNLTMLFVCLILLPTWLNIWGLVHYSWPSNSHIQYISWHYLSTQIILYFRKIWPHEVFRVEIPVNFSVSRFQTVQVPVNFAALRFPCELRYQSMIVLVLFTFTVWNTTILNDKWWITNINVQSIYQIFNFHNFTTAH